MKLGPAYLYSLHNPILEKGAGWEGCFESLQMVHKNSVCERQVSGNNLGRLELS